MKLKPLHDWVVIKVSEAEEMSPGGIIIPDTAKDRPSEGIVMSVGPGNYKKTKGKEKFVPTTLQPGQRVAYPKYMVKEVEVGGEKFALLREDDILGTFGGEKRLVRKEPAQPDRPKATREVKEVVPAVSGVKESPGKKRVTRKKAVRKSTKTAGEKKTKKETKTRSVTTKTGPKAVKKPSAKKKEKTSAPKKATKKIAGTKKTTGRKSPSKGKIVQRRKAGPSPMRKRKKSQPGVIKKRK